MSKLVALLIAGSLHAVCSNECLASDWMFRRSWFSHAPEPGQPVPQSRSAIRRAVPQIGPGFAVRSTYRFNVYRIRNGQSYDTTVFRQFSFQGSP